MGKSKKGSLSRKRTLLKKHEIQKTDDFVYFQYGDDGDSFRVGYYLPISEFSWMGEPDEITVTVHPGHHMRDNLDDEGSYEKKDG